jgi:hypothetical protein
MTPELSLHKLNLLVAETVMGWKRVPLAMLKHGKMFSIHASGGLDPVYFRDHESALSWFRPTTDAAQAMGVLERCAEKCSRPMKSGGSISDVIAISVGCERWSVGFHPPMLESAETLPLAICKFAVRIFK